MEIGSGVGLWEVRWDTHQRGICTFEGEEWRLAIGYTECIRNPY